MNSINDKQIAASIDWSIPVAPQELEQLREVARLPLSQKLEWLEESQRLVEALRAGRIARQALQTSQNFTP